MRIEWKEGVEVREEIRAGGVRGFLRADREGGGGELRGEVGERVSKRERVEVGGGGVGSE